MSRPGVAHQVDEPPRRGDHDLRAAADIPHLTELVHATKHAGETRLRILRVLHVILAGLRRQFACGTEDQRARMAHLRLCCAARTHQSIKDRQQKRRRLAGTGLRAADQVAAVEDRRDRLLLDRRGKSVADIRDRIAQTFVQPVENRIRRPRHHFPSAAAMMASCAFFSAAASYFNTLRS